MLVYQRVAMMYRYGSWLRDEKKQWKETTTAHECCVLLHIPHVQPQSDRIFRVVSSSQTSKDFLAGSISLDPDPIPKFYG